MSSPAVYARVRISGPSLEPLQVSRALGLFPAGAERGGEGLSHQQGTWSLSSRGFVSAPELDAHLRWLLDQLEPRGAELQQLLAAGARAELLCYSPGSDERAQHLPGSTLGRCAALSLPVVREDEVHLVGAAR